MTEWQSLSIVSCRTRSDTFRGSDQRSESVVHRAVVAAMSIAVVGCSVGMPRATADNPVCTPTVCAFLSPSRNISCEIDYQRDPGIPDETYCQTMSPPQSARLSADGVVTNCVGSSCLGNAGVRTPTLGYGESTGIGPFSCQSQVNGVTCSVSSGRGFIISDAGVAPAG
jgi:hypothetical protein